MAWTRRKQIDIASGLADSNLSQFPVQVDRYDADLLTARPDGADIAFTDADGTTLLPHAIERFTPVIVEGAGQYWFNQPHWVYDPQSNKTFGGWMGLDSWQTIGSYDHATGVWETNKVFKEQSPDDHEIPQCLVRADGVVMFFMSAHGSGGFRQWTADSPGQITSGSLTDLTFLEDSPTYPEAVQFPGGDILLTWRESVPGSRGYSISTDGGATWGSKGIIVAEVDNQRPYLLIKRDGTKLHLFFSKGHPRYGETPQGENSLYHAYYDHADGNVYRSNGSLIGALSTTPASINNATVIENAATRGFNFWNYDIAIDSQGNPIVAYVEHREEPEFVDASANDRVTLDVRHRYGRWTGSEWVTHEIEQSSKALQNTYVYGGGGMRFYTPGLCLDHTDPSRIYVSVRDGNGLTLTERYTSDGGASFVTTRLIAKGGFWPRTVKRAGEPMGGGASGFNLTYLSGDYDHLNSRWDTDICCFPSTAAITARLTSRVLIPTLNSGSGASLYIYYGNASRDAIGTTAADDFTVTESVGDLVPSERASPNIAGLSAVTIEVVARRERSDNNTMALASNWGSQTGARFFIRLANGSTVEAEVDTDNGRVGGQFSGLNVGSSRFYIALRLNAGEVQAFLNETLSDTVYTGAGSISAPVPETPLWVGMMPNTTGQPHSGDVYLLRVSTVSRSDAWIRASSRTMLSPETYLTVSAEESGTYGSVGTPAAPVGLSLSEQDPGAPNAPIAVSLSEADPVTEETYTFSGTVTRDGNTVAGADVVFITRADLLANATAQTTTDASGAYSAEIPTGEEMVGIALEGADGDSTPFTEGA